MGINVRLSMKECVSEDIGKRLHISDNQDDTVLGILILVLLKLKVHRNPF